VNVPVLAVDVVETVRVEGAVAGLSEHVAPDGQPVTATPTVPVNPFTAVIVIEDVPDLPCVRVSDAGLAEIVKFGTAAALTVSVTVVE
jgi:hypothetical protein